MKWVSLGSAGCAVVMGVCMSLCLSTTGLAQTLDAIDASRAMKPGMVKPSPPSPAPHPNDSCLIDPVSDAACYAGGVALFYGGIVSWERATGNIEASETGKPDYTARTIGEPLIPILRLDGQLVRPKDGISALDTRIEVGFGPAAIDLQSSAFTEDGSDSDLTETRWHVLYRMSFSDQLELDLGVGGIQVDRENTENGYSFTAPIRYHPFHHVGFELWPAWSEINGSRVDDYEFSLLLDIGWASVKPGYRVWNFGSETLEGPAVGISFHW